MSGRASGIKMVGMTRDGAPISLFRVVVHPDCWCVCLCYLHFAPENPEDGEMDLLVPSRLGCPTQSCKMVVCVTCKYNFTMQFDCKLDFRVLKFSMELI